VGGSIGSRLPKTVGHFAVAYGLKTAKLKKTRILQHKPYTIYISFIPSKKSMS